MDPKPMGFVLITSSSVYLLLLSECIVSDDQQWMSQMQAIPFAKLWELLKTQTESQKMLLPSL